VHRFVDTIHGRPDRHGCIWGDPNLDGLLDLVCARARSRARPRSGTSCGSRGRRAMERRGAPLGDRGRVGPRPAPDWIDLNNDKYPDLFHRQRRAPCRRSNVAQPDVRERRWDALPRGEPRVTRQDGSSCVQTVDVNDDGGDDLLLCGDKRTICTSGRATGSSRGRALRRAARADRDGARSPTCRANGMPTSCSSRCTPHGFGSGHDGSFGGPVLSMPMAHGHELAIGDVDGNGTPRHLRGRRCANRVNRPISCC
jgi:hypothetical protein